MKKKKYRLLVVFCVFFILAAIFAVILLKDTGNNDNSIFVTAEKNNDNLDASISSNGYKVSIYDDEIDFIDSDGNIISYVFEDDKLSSVQEILFADSIEEVNALKDFYEEKIATGEIERIVQEEKMISVIYNMNYFEEYLTLTKDEIQSLLLKESNFKENN